MLKTFFRILALISILLFLPSCTKTKGSTNGPVSDVAASQPLTLAVFYVKFTERESYLVREVHQVPAGKDPHVAAVEELISGQVTTPGASRILPPQTRVLGVTVKDGTATVNFSREVLEQHGVGAEGEALAIQSVVNTLTEFPEIRQVSFQVEGKVDERVRDWWGHVGLFHQPFHRDLSKTYEPAIWITHPMPGQVAGSPLLVKGSARVFEGRVQARLVDDQGRVLATAATTASKGAPERGDFEIRLNYQRPQKGGEGTLEVFSPSPKDGSPENKVIVNVRWP